MTLDSMMSKSRLKTTLALLKSKITLSVKTEHSQLMLFVTHAKKESMVCGTTISPSQSLSHPAMMTL